MTPTLGRALEFLIAAAASPADLPGCFQLLQHAAQLDLLLGVEPEGAVTSRLPTRVSLPRMNSRICSRVGNGVDVDLVLVAMDSSTEISAEPGQLMCSSST